MSDENLDLFVPPNVRTPDMPASIEAGKKVESPAANLRSQILWHIEKMQPVTALELEELPPFEKLAPSTVRKRVSELKALGRIVEDGVKYYHTAAGRKAHATAWRIAS